MDHVQENQPSLVVLWAFQGKPVPALLGQRLLGYIFRKLQAFSLHANVVEHRRVGTMFRDEQRLHLSNPFPNNHAEALTSSHLMNQLDGRVLVAKFEGKSARHRLIYRSQLVTFHREGRCRAYGNRVQSVQVAVVVHLDDKVSVEDAAVAAQAGNGFVLRTVDEDAAAFVGPGLQLEVLHAVGAGQ